MSTVTSDKGIKRLVQQFIKSEKFKGMISAFLKQTDDLHDSAAMLLLDRTLEKAEGKQLDGIGDIVGIDRPIGADDERYRWMVKAKIMVNSTDMTVDNTLRMMYFVFGENRVKYTIEQNLSPVYTIEKTIKDEELFIFDILPKLLGIEVTYQSIGVYAETFSFDGDEGLGFGDTTDPNIGGIFSRIIV